MTRRRVTASTRSCGSRTGRPTWSSPRHIASPARCAGPAWPVPSNDMNPTGSGAARSSPAARSSRKKGRAAGRQQTGASYRRWRTRHRFTPEVSHETPLSRQPRRVGRSPSRLPDAGQDTAKCLRVTARATPNASTSTTAAISESVHQRRPPAVRASAILRIAAGRDRSRVGLPPPLEVALIRPFHCPGRPAFLHFPVIFGCKRSADGPRHPAEHRPGHDPRGRGPAHKLPTMWLAQASPSGRG